jgi:hypothetical protein
MDAFLLDNLVGSLTHRLETSLNLSIRPIHARIQKRSHVESVIVNSIPVNQKVSLLLPKRTSNKVYSRACLLGCASKS